jgi:hypothetical protein
VEEARGPFSGREPTIDLVTPSTHGSAKFLVTDLASLRGLTAHSGPAPGTIAMKVSVDGATPAENAAWERGLRRHVGACGCELGAASVALVLGAFALTRVGLGHRLSPRLGAEIGIWVGVGFAAALVGKLLGLARSRLALRRIGREIATATDRGLS